MTRKSIVIIGPTASGKSAYAVHLAECIRGSRVGGFAEIISADSRQVYTGLDIGTGKITHTETRGVPHHMLDICDARTEIMSAHSYAQGARAYMHEVWEHGGVPIICGGTGFFIDSLLGRITLPDVPRDDVLRAELAGKSGKELLQMLRNIDPARAKVIEEKREENNTVRLVRAIEVALSRTSHFSQKSSIFLPPAGQTFTQNAFSESASQQVHEILWLGLRPTDTEMREKIRERLHERLEAGMLDEVRQLHKDGLSWERMDTLGLEYRYCARHLQGILSYDELTIQLEQKIWQYAKRQITYWRRNTDIHWHHPSDYAGMDERAARFLDTT